MRGGDRLGYKYVASPIPSVTINLDQLDYLVVVKSSQPQQPRQPQIFTHWWLLSPLTTKASMNWTAFTKTEVAIRWRFAAKEKLSARDDDSLLERAMLTI